jgi:predicted SPOUT superfamily RNA methylase MTH1
LKRRGKFSLAFPASIVSDIPHLREKTLKIGLIARAASIFRVDELIIFTDNLHNDQKKDSVLIMTILRYLETPQYLRKRLFKIRPELRYVGIIPPLRTPHHPLASRKKDLTLGEFREGVVISSTKKGSLVDVGIESPILLPQERIPINFRITVKLTNLRKSPSGILADHQEIRNYWGYSVKTSKTSLGKFLKRSSFDLVIATSRYGNSMNKIQTALRKEWKKAYSKVLIFGGPKLGLYDIASQEGIELDHISDFVINAIPHQGTETVRTEEAIYASLSILNNFIEEGIP